MPMNQILITEKELWRYEMVQARLKSGCKIEKILSDYGVSRRAFYSNLHKFKKEGLAGLKSKWGKHRKIDGSAEQELIALFNKHPYFSSYEFSQIMGLKPRTIQRIIVRNHLVKTHKNKKERTDIIKSLRGEKKGFSKKTRSENKRI